MHPKRPLDLSRSMLRRVFDSVPQAHAAPAEAMREAFGALRSLQREPSAPALERAQALVDRADSMLANVPALAGARTRLLTARSALERLSRARDSFAAIDRGLLGAGLKAMTDLELAPSERRAALSAASGDALTDAAMGILEGVAALVPHEAFAKAGFQLQEVLAPNGELAQGLDDHWWTTFVPTDLARAGEGVDALFASVEQPDFRHALDGGLNVLRVAGRLQAHNLERIAVDLPVEERAAARAAVASYAAGLVRLGVKLVDDAERKAFPDRERPALPRFEDGELERLLGGLLRVLTVAQAEPEGRSAQVLATSAELVRLEEVGGQLREVLERLPQALLPLLQQPGGPLADPELAAALEGLNHTLTSELDARVKMTPDGKAALGDMLADVRATLKVLGRLAQMAGAMGNPKMDEAERTECIQLSAERMGPLFVKLLQTAAQYGAMFGALDQAHPGQTQDAGSPDVVVKALQRLQDRVTPMPFEQVEEQLKKQFGGRGVDEVFVPGSFEKEPIASASIGQVHRARVVTREGRRQREIDVVVKVQRPGLEAEFEDTVRVATLALAVVKETVRLLPSLDESERQHYLQLADWFETTLNSFIESFIIETDFREEAKSGAELAWDLRADPYVTVPKTLAEFSGREVLTLEMMRGDKLDVHLARYERAKAARLQPLPKTALLPGTAGREAAVARALLLAEQTYGAPPDPDGVQLRQTPKGYEVRVPLRSEISPSVESSLHTVADISVSRDGRSRVLSQAPDLSEGAVVDLRERLASTFLSQLLVHGFVHGDMHKGNFFVLKDGKTVALLDTGNMVKLRKKDVGAPGLFAYGLWRKQPERMAKSLFAMSNRAETATPSEKARLLRDATARCAEMAERHGAGGSSEQILDEVLTVCRDLGLGLAPVYLQGIKTAVSMLGNMVSFQSANVSLNPLATGRAVARSLLQESVGVVSPHAFLVRGLKNRRVKRLNSAE